MFLCVTIIATATLAAVVTAGFQGASTSDSTPPATAERTSSPCCRRSPAALEGPLDNDDLLREILLRLPPQPSSLPRASLVCKHWGRLFFDLGFTRRFRLHHRNNPPLLGHFAKSFHDIYFLPTLDPPTRLPKDRFRLQFDEGDNSFTTLGCRHGLALIYHVSRDQLLVWDPVNGDRHRLDIPPGFETKETQIHGAVLQAAGDAHHFLVVLVGNDEKQYTRALACVCSSQTGAWGNLISTLLPPKPKDGMSSLPTTISLFTPSVLVGDSLYWILTKNSVGILEFDLGRQSLAVISLPVVVFAKGITYFTVVRAEDGGLGCLFMSGISAQFWKRKTDRGGVASSWVLGRTIELDKVPPMNSGEKRGGLMVLGFAEDNNVAVMWTLAGLFMVQMESLQFKKLIEPYFIQGYRPFESVYTAETSICGGNEDAELLLGA